MVGMAGISKADVNARRVDATAWRAKERVRGI